MELVRKQTYITPEQDAALKRIAAEEQTTEAEVLRRALDALLELEARERESNPLARLIGFVDLPLAKNDHDDIYR
jgi:hypothetical protein